MISAKSPRTKKWKIKKDCYLPKSIVCLRRKTDKLERGYLFIKTVPTIVLIPPPMDFIKEREKKKDYNDDSLVPSIIYR